MTETRNGWIFGVGAVLAVGTALIPKSNRYPTTMILDDLNSNSRPTQAEQRLHAEMRHIAEKPSLSEKERRRQLIAGTKGPKRARWSS